MAHDSLWARLYFIRPEVLIRIALDFAALVSWVVLASENLAPAVAATGSAIFASGSVWFWSLLHRSEQRGDIEKPTVARNDEGRRQEVERLSSFVHGSEERRKASLRDPHTGLYQAWYLEQRIEEEGQRCHLYGLSMALVVLQFEAGRLSEWMSDRWHNNEAQPQIDWHILTEGHLGAGLSPYEIAICLVHCDRAGAETAIEKIRSQLPATDFAVGFAIYPDEDLDPNALIEIARLRAKPISAFSNPQSQISSFEDLKAA